MSTAREKDQADFDLERFIDMFDEALTSQDPRVMRSLRDLMMMVTLTRPETSREPATDREHGPLRRLFEDMHHLNRRLHRLEEEHRSLVQTVQNSQREAAAATGYGYDRDYNYPYEKYSLAAEQARRAGMVPEKINPDVLNQLKALNGSKVKGLLDK